MRRIETNDDIALALEELLRSDPRLVPVAEAAGPLPLRRVAPGFASLVAIVVSQQISRASAAAIMARLQATARLEPAPLLALTDDDWRAVGMSRPKQRTLIALSAGADGLGLEAMAELPPEEALARLTALHGIGPWTAEVYLLFAEGHADVFPAGDVALQGAAAQAFAMDRRPDARELRALAESWAPWRGVAARLLWAYWAAMRGRDATPPVPNAKRNGESGLSPG